MCAIKKRKQNHPVEQLVLKPFKVLLYFAECNALQSTLRTLVFCPDFQGKKCFTLIS